MSSSPPHLSSGSLQNPQMERIFAFSQMNLDLPLSPERQMTRTTAPIHSLADKCLSKSAQKSLGGQIRQYPFLLAIRNTIRDDFEQWCFLKSNNARYSKIRKIKQRVAQRLKLLNLLSDLIAQATTNSRQGDLQRILRVFPLSPKQLEDDFRKTKQSPAYFETLFHKRVQISTNRLKRFEKTIAPYRQEHRISPIALQGEVLLCKRIRQIIRFSLQGSIQARYATDAKNVICLSKFTDSSKASQPGWTNLKQLAFIKLNRTEQESTLFLEGLVWELAILFGAEAFFAPTYHHYKSGLDSSNEQSKKQSLIDLVPLLRQNNVEAHEISVQLPLEGVEFYRRGKQDSKFKNVPIDRNNLVEAVAVSLLFGMFDAHSGNIILTSEGIKFFDNTRSLPNGNGLLLRHLEYKHERFWEDIRVSFYCHLIGIPEAGIPMSDAERVLLRGKIQQYKAKMSKVEVFLKSASILKKIAKLPHAWFHVDHVIAAMHERLQGMERALDIAGALSLCDFAMHAIKDYRFAFSICFIHSYPKNQISHTNLRTALDGLNKMNIDLKKIKELAEDPSLHIDQLKNTLVKEWCQSSLSAQQNLVLCSQLETNQEMMNRLTKNAVIDFKDWYKEGVAKAVTAFNLRKLINNPFISPPTTKWNLRPSQIPIPHMSADRTASAAGASASVRHPISHAPGDHWSFVKDEKEIAWNKRSIQAPAVHWHPMLGYSIIYPLPFALMRKFIGLSRALNFIFLKDGSQRLVPIEEFKEEIVKLTTASENVIFPFTDLPLYDPEYAKSPGDCSGSIFRNEDGRVVFLKVEAHGESVITFFQRDQDAPTVRVFVNEKSISLLELWECYR